MTFARVVAVIAALASAAAQETPRFRTDVSLVRIDAEVTDGTRTLTGLGQADFQVFDENEPQQIIHFSEGEEPLDLILLFDVSGSMRRALEQISASARVALAELRPGDRVAVMSFSRSSRLVTAFTEDLGEVERAIFGQVLKRIRGGTRIMAAVDDAAGYFLNTPRTGRRRAVLIVTDNIGVRSRQERKVVRKYWEADVVLSGIILRDPRLDLQREYMRFAPHWRLLLQGMKGVARQTGGDVLEGGDAADAFHESMRRIRRRYSIYYRMPAANPGNSRSVRVDLSDTVKDRLPGARVRARKGYITPASLSAEIPGSSR